MEHRAPAGVADGHLQPFDGLEPASPVVRRLAQGLLASLHVQYAALAERAQGDAEGVPVALGVGDAGLQGCRLIRVSRFTAVCAIHGAVAIDEYADQRVCPLAEGV